MAHGTNCVCSRINVHIFQMTKIKSYVIKKIIFYTMEFGIYLFSRFLNRMHRIILNTHKNKTILKTKPDEMKSIIRLFPERF